MVEPFIRLRGVRKVYGSAGKEHLAISDATFDVMPGELVSLVGPSGCGKSTLLKILAGLHPHDGGELRIGSETHTFDPSRDVGMVFQAPLLLKWRRNPENGLLPGGRRRGGGRARALVHAPKRVRRDEPFGALDALTREKMNLELLRIWKEAGKTIIFVTHGISEAVFLGTRVVVLTAGPAKMADNIAIDLPRPRTLDMKTHERFGEYTRRIYRHLGME